LSGSELLVVILVALFLFGGKKLPEIARTAGKTIRDFRRMWEETKRQMGLDLMDDTKPPAKKKSPQEKNP
jgi:sec-independent protein translocase protein TatA